MSRPSPSRNATRAEPGGDGRHLPVMLEPVLAALALRPDGAYLDGTFGRGGHARAILARLDQHGRLWLIDRDPDAVRAAQSAFGDDRRVQIRQGSFTTMLSAGPGAAALDGVLLDLGVSSPQLDQPARGFSFQQDGPLDMRMDPSHGVSAATWLAAASETEIADVLWRYGEEKASRRIARAIVEQRVLTPLTGTAQLRELIARAIGRSVPGKHPATRSFQAIRMHVNDELGELDAGLEAAAQALKPGGRLVVISFHSLEDRAVKRFLRGDSKQRPVRRGLPQPPRPAPRWRLTAAAQFASDSECAHNPRARSAVLRQAERLP
ncbi:MAG: 16S rRNA (cytosine(1402)-N(4))-methyltransferase RsmH [Lysobacterales bacterium]